MRNRRDNQMRVDLFIHNEDGGSTSDPAVLARIETKLNQIGVAMSAQSEAIDRLLERINVDVQHLLDAVTAAQASEAQAQADLLVALGNDAADADALAAAQAAADAATAARDAALADAQEAVDRINAIDPVADFPPPEQ